MLLLYRFLPKDIAKVWTKERSKPVTIMTDIPGKGRIGHIKKYPFYGHKCNIEFFVLLFIYRLNVMSSTIAQSANPDQMPRQRCGIWSESPVFAMSECPLLHDVFHIFQLISYHFQTVCYNSKINNLLLHRYTCDAPVADGFVKNEAFAKYEQMLYFPQYFQQSSATQASNSMAIK